MPDQLTRAPRRAGAGQDAEAAPPAPLLDDVLDELLSRVAETLDVDACTVALVDDGGEAVLKHPTKGLGAEDDGAVRVPLHESLAGRVVAEHRAIAVEDVAEGDLVDPLLCSTGIRSLCGAPLKLGNRVLGVVQVGTLVPHRFTPEEVHMLEVVADQSALAVDRARLHAFGQRGRADAAGTANVLDHVDEGIFMLDSQQVVRLWNRAAAAITGLEADAAVGRPVDEVIADWPNINDLIPVVPNAAQPPSEPEIVLVDVAARELWLSISGVRFPEGTVYIFADLTRVHLLLERQTEFLTHTAHAFRTPLTAIYGAAATLQRPDLELDEEMRALLISIIHAASERLSRLVDDSLLMNRIESETIDMVVEQFDPLDVAQQAIEAVKARVSQPLSLELNAPHDLPLVGGAADKVRDVLVNLLDNAIKHSSAGGRVELGVEPQACSVLFSVRDEGPGIPVQEHARIFEKFYRTEADATSGTSSVGIGLYICHELVRRMNGRIWVASGENMGSTFFFDFPLAQAYGATEPL
jgi:PAS domain S-box-containing protein